MNVLIYLKNIRNYFFLKIFLCLGHKNAQLFIKNNIGLKDKNLLIVISFNQTWCLDWLLKMSKENVKDAVICIFDNSSIQSKRFEIERLCNKYDVIYHSLPLFRIKHPNRSHGFAMTWVFNNIVRHLNPKNFAFIDHDLIPIKPFFMSKQIKNQPCYGITRDTVNPFYWSLWAGYCIFNFAFVKNKFLNFSNDFSRNLDTGGMNWNFIYKFLDKKQLHFASREFHIINTSEFSSPFKVEFIDHHWIHIGGTSYRSSSKERIILFNKIFSKFQKGFNKNYFF